MRYINSKGEYPRHAGDIQIEHPKWNMGDDLPEGWSIVEPTVAPDYDPELLTVEEAPENVDGVWRQVWSQRPLTDEERASRFAPETAKQKLIDLGLTEVEIRAIAGGLI